MNGKIISINVSDKKGERKTPVKEVLMVADFGIKDDAHASSQWHRQVSLLALESIKKMQDMGLDVGPGDFAENITTEGINLPALPIGTLIKIGDTIKGEVTQIGKVCHDRCAIYEQAGDCVMPKEGIFIKVLSGGTMRQGDSIEISA